MKFTLLAILSLMLSTASQAQDSKWLPKKGRTICFDSRNSVSISRLAGTELPLCEIQRPEQSLDFISLELTGLEKGTQAVVTLKTANSQRTYSQTYSVQVQDGLFYLSDLENMKSDFALLTSKNPKSKYLLFRQILDTSALIPENVKPRTEECSELQHDYLEMKSSLSQNNVAIGLDQIDCPKP